MRRIKFSLLFLTEFTTFATSLKQCDNITVKKLCYLFSIFCYNAGLDFIIRCTTLCSQPSYLLVGSISRTVPRLLGNGNRHPSSWQFLSLLQDGQGIVLAFRISSDPVYTKASDPTTVSTRLGESLHFLATGHAHSELNYEFRIGWLRPHI